MNDEDWVWIIHEERAIWVFGKRIKFHGFYNVLAADGALVILWNYEVTPDRLRNEAAGCPYRKATRSEVDALIAMAQAREALE